MTFVCACLCTLQINAQWRYEINAHSTLPELSTSGILEDSISCYIYSDELINNLRAQQFYEANVDSISYQDSLCNIHLHAGPKYTSEISIGNLPITLLKELKIRPKDLMQDYDPIQSADDTEKIIDFYNNTGYPYAVLELDSLDLDEGLIKAAWKIIPGTKMYFDTIETTGNARMASYFLHQYLDIEPLSPFDLSKFNDIPRKLKSLDYVTLKEDPEISVFDQWARIELLVEPRNTNRFDLIFGIIPSEDSEERNFYFSWDIKAKLENQLGLGERLLFSYEKLRPEHQQLNLSYDMLYPFSLPLGLDFDFSFFRRSLEYNEVIGSAGIVFPFSHNDRFVLSGVFKRNRLIEIDTLSILNSAKLPENLDVRSDGIALSAEFSTLDYLFNPYRGWQFIGSVNANVRSIIPNNQILAIESQEIDFSSSYDSIAEPALSLDLISHLNYFLPLGKRSTWMQGVQAKYKYIKGPASVNELYRIGGNKTLRGFDEQTFFVRSFIRYVTEYRLILAEKTYFSLPFVELALFQNLDLEWNQTLGIGAGLVFETRAGMLNLSFAVGKLNDNPIDLARPKVHVGFNSLF